jgi:CubicO group peptidase (beta-lactamase class C family)
VLRDGLLVLSALSLCAAPALAQDITESQGRRVDSLFASYNASPSPGLALAVVRDGKVILRGGYGLADMEHRVPITPSTVFDVASVSKQFTGLAVAMLVTEGKIRLTDDIGKYIPELPDFGHPITIDHLLHHKSGIRDWPGTLSVGGWQFDDVISFDQILTMAYHQRELNFVPGAEFLYSNTGYNLLAEMVQRVTGRPFRAWTEEQFFRPLGMTSTHFRDDHTEVIANRALGYAHARDGSWRNTTNNLTALGSSSLFSTADDMARWLINFGDAKAGGAAAMSLMRTRGVLNDGTTIPYAFGITMGSYRGLPMFTHSGSWASFTSFDVYMPEQRFGIVVLANGSSIDAQGAVIKVANILLEKELASAPPAPAGPGVGPPAAASASPGVDVPPSTLDEYAGLYRLGPGWYTRISRSGATLTSQATREDPAPMIARSDREFWVENYGASMTFTRDSSGRVAALEYRGRRAPKIDESASRPPPRLSDYVGEYESDELRTSYRVVLKDGALAMEHPRFGSIPLTWLLHEEFGSPQWFMRSVEFRRDGSGKVVGLTVNGDLRSRDIRFVKRLSDRRRVTSSPRLSH